MLSVRTIAAVAVLTWFLGLAQGWGESRSYSVTVTAIVEPPLQLRTGAAADTEAVIERVRTTDAERLHTATSLQLPATQQPTDHLTLSATTPPAAVSSTEQRARVVALYTVVAQ